ncbi:MAG: helix-turn-helix domain-containing protein [Deltaproteobacteria bacterium]|nr:MAG: helix-turn-helix domain-containing protein [Deltaproteobacteria bacterium]
MSKRKNKRKQTKGRQAKTKQQAVTKSQPEPKADAIATPDAPAPLLVTVPQLCQMLNVSRSTLYRMEQTGKLPGRIQLGGQVRYHLETVQEWLRSLAQGSES